MPNKKRVLVIGAGAAGLTAIKACREAGLEAVCYERGGQWGGLWRYRAEDGVDGIPSVMQSTISNTSKEMSSFSDFPPPPDYPSYLHHTLVLKYLEAYAEHFELLGCIAYYQEVMELIPAEDYGTSGEWLVKVRHVHSGESREETFDGVMACVGHHSYPYTPTYSNMDLFSGGMLHSHAYKTPAGMEDKKVLVIGAGNSGADIAVEVSKVAKKVYLSTRRGAWIYPRLFDEGKPMDICLTRRSRTLLPAKYATKQVEKKLNHRMDHGRFGLRPYHSTGAQHPTINDELQAKLLVGDVSIKRDVKEFSSDGVLFDGDSEFTPIDVVVFATGFHIKFPFLTDDILRVGQNNKVFLYKNVFPPQLKHHTLAVIGLVQPTGSLLPVFEMQSRWFAALMTGKCRLPATEKMLAKVRKTEGVRARSYVPSPRHSIEVPWIGYMDDIAAEFGAKPNMATLMFTDHKLFRACLLGPCLPYQYRLVGPNQWQDAREAILTYKSRLFYHLMNEQEHEKCNKTNSRKIIYL